MWSSWWNESENLQGKPKYLEKVCPSAPLFTTNSTLPDLGLNLGYCSGKLLANHLSYGMVQINVVKCACMYEDTIFQ
jgi:hypothetical protein